MLGTHSLLTFAFRAAVLLLLAPLAWLALAARYNELLVVLTGPLAPAGSLDSAGRYILVTAGGLPAPLAVDGFTLHSGMMLLAVLVLAAVRIGVAARTTWLAGLAAGCVTLHVLGLAALALALARSTTGGVSEATVLRLFAALWGLLPAAAGAAWYLLYWLPRASPPATAVDGGAASA